MTKPQLFDLIEVLTDIPAKNLVAGMRGNIVDVYGSNEAFEIEFLDAEGNTIDLITLTPDWFDVVWRAQSKEWVSASERVAGLVERLPEAKCTEVLDFTLFLSARESQRYNQPTTAC